jgi:hypothetical protein
MFDIQYLDREIAKKMEKLETYFPCEVSQELPQYLKQLREKGEISKVDFFRGNINQLNAVSFKLSYISDHVNKIVKIIDIKVNSMDLLKSRFSIIDSWDDKDIFDNIPQCDVPSKMIKTIELINQGINTSYDIGIALGSKASQKRYVERHAQYATEALQELSLIERKKQSRKFILDLTPKGQLIADALDEDTKKRLIVEAMLNYRPVWLIIGEVTKGGKELTDKLIKNLVFHEEDHNSDTSNRRSQTLKNWVKYISKFTGIPICLTNQTLQLTIPMLYGEADGE